MDRKKRVLTEAQEAYLREHFASDASCDIADVFGISAPTVRRIAKELGLSKSSDFCVNDFCGRYVRRYVRS